ncbi:hypothetical protein CW304_32005 [Bacillus sp. UFRGS-B20]|nr:hypothetical protein CW304_32005 [Bacillus sp. UFRGS-B20]
MDKAFLSYCEDLCFVIYQTRVWFLFHFCGYVYLLRLQYYIEFGGSFFYHSSFSTVSVAACNGILELNILIVNTSFSFILMKGADNLEPRLRYI